MANKILSLEETLTKYAKSDLRTAKKNGCVGITATKKGNIEIEYIRETGMFQASNFNNTNIKLTPFMSEKEMVSFVAGIYSVGN